MHNDLNDAALVLGGQVPVALHARVQLASGEPRVHQNPEGLRQALVPTLAPVPDQRLCARGGERSVSHLIAHVLPNRTGYARVNLRSSNHTHTNT